MKQLTHNSRTRTHATRTTHSIVIVITRIAKKSITYIFV